MNGNLKTVDNRPTLRFERRLPHSPERVWRAITEPDELRRWSPATPEWTLEPGATFTVDGFDKDTGRILEVDPPRLLAYVWDKDHLRFELTPDGDGCVLVFTHAFDDRAIGAQTAAGWELCLERLDALLAGSPLGERESLSGWPELHEAYAEEFGLDSEVGRRTFSEHMARH